MHHQTQDLLWQSCTGGTHPFANAEKAGAGAPRPSALLQRRWHVSLSNTSWKRKTTQLTQWRWHTTHTQAGTSHRLLMSHRTVYKGRRPSASTRWHMDMRPPRLANTIAQFKHHVRVHAKTGLPVGSAQQYLVTMTPTLAGQ